MKKEKSLFPSDEEAHYYTDKEFEGILEASSGWFRNYWIVLKYMAASPIGIPSMGLKRTRQISSKAKSKVAELKWSQSKTLNSPSVKRSSAEVQNIGQGLLFPTDSDYKTDGAKSISSKDSTRVARGH